MKAIIVDGGRATRLGVESPKGLVTVNEIPLVGYLWSRLVGLGVNDMTLVIGNRSHDAYKESEFGKAATKVIDHRMDGPLAALYQVVDRFRDEDVIITTGDAFYETLDSLRGCARNSVLALVDAPRRGSAQIRMAGSGVDYVDLKFAPGSMSYASAIRVNKCSAFWQGVREGVLSGRRMIADALVSDTLVNVEFRAVNGFWRDVNEPSDLEAVRDYVENR